jgi:hypothetical protein
MLLSCSRFLVLRRYIYYGTAGFSSRSDRNNLLLFGILLRMQTLKCTGQNQNPIRSSQGNRTTSACNEPFPNPSTHRAEPPLQILIIHHLSFSLLVRTLTCSQPRNPPFCLLELILKPLPKVLLVLIQVV